MGKYKEELELDEDTESLKEKPVPPAVFRIRFDEEGKLDNLDLKKPKPKPDLKASVKKINKLSNLKKIKKKGKSEKSAEAETEKGGKFSKLKGGIGKVSKIKNISKIKGVIPGRGKKKEEITCGFWKSRVNCNRRN